MARTALAAAKPSSPVPAETPGCRGEQPHRADHEAPGLGLGDSSATVSAIPESPPLSAAWPAVTAATEDRGATPILEERILRGAGFQPRGALPHGDCDPQWKPLKDGPFLLWTDRAMLVAADWNGGGNTWGEETGGRAPSGSGGEKWSAAAGLRLAWGSLPFTPSARRPLSGVRGGRDPPRELGREVQTCPQSPSCPHPPRAVSSPAAHFLHSSEACTTLPPPELAAAAGPAEPSHARLSCPSSLRG